jgi:RNA polymerase sigma-70 factor (ECF subfamily)
VFASFTKGDTKAFEYIFKSYSGYLLNYSRQILKDDAAAEEIVESVFLSLWENRENIRLESSLKAYLFKTAYHHCLNFLKHLRVQDRYVLYFKHHVPTDDAGNIITGEYPVSILIEKELTEIIENSIRRLPDQCREVFRMSRFESMKNEDIARKLDISVNTVRTHISRALARLREDLKEYL